MKLETAVKNLNNSMKFEERLEKLGEENAKYVQGERTGKNGAILNMMGRKAYFEEYFNGIKLENQIFEKLPGLDVDPKETYSFKLGYLRGEELVKIGNIPPEYQDGPGGKGRG